MVDAAGKKALITGASRGIGRATAMALSKAGISVYLAADGTAGELQAAVEECDAANPANGASFFGVFDLAEPDAAERMVETAVGRMGGIDILVNNAAVRNRRPFGEFTAAEFDELIAVNLRAPFLASQAVLPAMRAGGGGRIIHVASQLGLVAYKDSALYGLSKAALINLTQAMAYELASSNIQVNAVSPGPIATDYNLQRMEADPTFLAQRAAYVPAGRFGKPEEVAEAILFLATSDGNYIQGHNLVIDGGYVIH